MGRLMYDKIRKNWCQSVNCKEYSYFRWMSLRLLIHEDHVHGQDWIYANLLNETDYGFHIDWEIRFKEWDGLKGQTFVKSGERQKLGKFHFQFVNENPVYVFDISRYSTQGLEDQQEKKIKTKAVQYVQQLNFMPEVQAYGKSFTLLDLDASSDLPHLQPKSGGGLAATEINPNAGIKEFSSFNPVIDLHIEQIRPDYESVNPVHYLMIQLSTLSDFIDQAYQLGLDEVVIIHGVGEGKLRQHVHDLLTHDARVGGFENQFDERYGYGATRVALID